MLSLRRMFATILVPLGIAGVGALAIGCVGDDVDTTQTASAQTRRDQYVDILKGFQQHGVEDPSWLSQEQRKLLGDLYGLLWSLDPEAQAYTLSFPSRLMDAGLTFDDLFRDPSLLAQFEGDGRWQRINQGVEAWLDEGTSSPATGPKPLAADQGDEQIGIAQQRTTLFTCGVAVGFLALIVDKLADIIIDAQDNLHAEQMTKIQAESAKEFCKSCVNGAAKACHERVSAYYCAGPEGFASQSQFKDGLSKEKGTTLFTNGQVAGGGGLLCAFQCD